MRLPSGRNSSDRKRSCRRPSPASTTVSRMWESSRAENKQAQLGENRRQHLLRLVNVLAPRHIGRRGKGFRPRIACEPDMLVKSGEAQAVGFALFGLGQRRGGR